VTNPGVGPYIESIHTVLQHTYYQWVPLMLAITAVTFYLPRFVWKNMEGGLMSFLCKDLKVETETGKRMEHAEKLRSVLLKIQSQN